ncbi:MAG: hypothetical protein E7498_00270 [Ruminococcus sp.]|nr:hypothetical protein [Ruminococcus sp.]MBQ7027134.1 hypothetical protein [Ruminococcus sp.]MBQ8582417.1 hypothetical protein [Ruminococcus sp.]MDD6059857.1 hypothetical protein [Ruminococcus sp.]
MNEKFHTYKGYPLVRSGRTIYYGYMSDPYVIMIQIMSVKKSDDKDITEKVRVIQMSTDPNLNPLEACVKNAERECGLYEALDIANVWLEKALAQ